MGRLRADRPAPSVDRARGIPAAPAAHGAGRAAQEGDRGAAGVSLGSTDSTGSRLSTGSALVTGLMRVSFFLQRETPTIVRMMIAINRTPIADRNSIPAGVGLNFSFFAMSIPLPKSEILLYVPLSYTISLKKKSM